MNIDNAVLIAQEFDGGGAAAAGGAIAMVMMVIYLAVIVLTIIGMWKAFEKAGKPGWAAIVPIYNVWVLTEISGRDVIWFILCLVPCINIVAIILICIDVAAKFGKGGGFGIGLAFLGFIFWPMLGFGDARYRG